MSWLFEDPMPVIYVAVVAEFLLIGFLVLTGRGVALFAMLGVAALAGVLLLVEHLVVTDVEVIEQTLADAAKAIESNDAEAVKKFIAEEDSVTRDRIDWVLDEYIFERVRIKSNLKVEVTDSEPKTARATFNAVATGGDKHGTFTGQVVPRFIIVKLRQNGERWLITDHEARDPREGLMKKAKQYAEGK